MAKEKPTTKLCKHCKTEIPYDAKVCPSCRKKQSSPMRAVVIAIAALFVICLVTNRGSDDKETPKNVDNSDAQSIVESNESKEVSTVQEPAPEIEIEYISVTATELSDALSNNAMKAQNDYKEKYLEITGKLGNIDSNGKYIDVNSDNDFDFTIIQCYLQTEEQKEVIMEMSKGDSIIIKGYCKDMGEILGYQIDIEEIIK